MKFKADGTPRIGGALSIAYLRSEMRIVRVFMMLVLAEKRLALK